MIEAKLIDEAGGYSYDSSVIELDQFWIITDVQIIAQVTVRYDPDGPSSSMATAILFDDDGKQIDFTFRDFPSRWWDGVRADMGMYSKMPSASMSAVASGLVDRALIVLQAVNGD